MPVPKRKTSKARRDQRQSTKFIRPQSITQCANCQEPLATHQACAVCGYYKGRKVLNTKLERTIKRTETRTALQAKAQQSAQSQDSNEQGHEQDNEK
ncbi:50S ribosomal protein L32 [Candidatus Dependentiae bacterium]|nr:50S ribosomal protein L32 [Candidatus Dependentiae bacterium]